jgi:hypothetical protein
MDQMILSEPSIIFIWTYQGMMEWMSRMLIGEMAGDDEDFQANEADCCSQPYPPSPTQHDPHGPDDPFRTINYLHLDISGHDAMDEQDVDWRNGW